MKKKKSPSLASLKKKAWKLLSECIRMEACQPGGYRIACYTCGAVDGWKSMQAGHAIGGRSGAVLFDEEIIRPQCVRCNIMLRGNYGEFTARWIREKAFESCRGSPNNLVEAMDWWEQKLLSAKQIKKWSRSDLQQKITEYKERLSKL